MLQVLERVESKLRSEFPPIGRWLTLPYDMRQRSRFRAQLDDGVEVAVMLGRGTVLRNGDVLEASDGTFVGVRAAPEHISVATPADDVAALRAAYHLGNRHIPLQIAQGRLIYLRDHVLDAMLERLGISVAHRHAPFDPEPGAYGAHGHAGSPRADAEHSAFDRHPHPHPDAAGRPNDRPSHDAHDAERKHASRASCSARPSPTHNVGLSMDPELLPPPRRRC